MGRISEKTVQLFYTQEQLRDSVAKKYIDWTKEVLSELGCIVKRGAVANTWKSYHLTISFNNTDSDALAKEDAVFVPINFSKEVLTFQKEHYKNQQLAWNVTHLSKEEFKKHLTRKIHKLIK